MPVVRLVIRWTHEAIVGTTLMPTIASCIHPIMVTFTHQGSVPFAPFAGGGDTLVVLLPVPQCGVVWVNITSARNTKLSLSRRTPLEVADDICTTIDRWSPCVSPYNALGNAATSASQLLKHSSELQRWCDKRRPASPLPPPPRLCCTQWDDRQNSHITLSTVEWTESEYRIFASGDLCIFH